MPKGQYGEPWFSKLSAGRVSTTGEDMYYFGYTEGDDPEAGTFIGETPKHIAARAVACVNALDGMDPRAVGQMIEICKRLNRWLPKGSQIMEKQKDLQDFHATLAKLESK